tara:strand:- start:1329 stop:1637 length:309 start_codon:yes stop_codon:yes gene_type:complete
MKLNRKQLRKLILEEVKHSNNRLDEIVPVVAIPLGVLVAAGLAGSTVEAEDVYKKLDPKVQKELEKVYKTLKDTMSYLSEDALEDVIAAAINAVGKKVGIID